ncbi:UDP-forming cellulose synthase catalytic subunit [Microcoleus sp. FACHB-1515]|uniref:UDP-forming cellulose synthase catalytic subunit n=1 Tax=Cyanophyceae TaxID=3028117 RepID=UPI001686E65A|nr:UDP-forming cellulose synthase catalytic subunit [Microcoleus sp. FACHB-1515]MBD2088423.1 UDP-forming cellulose synthase catalytic subunit [Microcoleus sp. FACHB-1515]
MTNVPQARRPSGFAGWLLNLPARFEQRMPNAGKWPLFCLVVLLLALSIPLIVTPLTVWQQTIVAVILILLGWFTVQVEQRQTQQQASEYLHLFLAWLSVVTTLRYLYYRTNYTLNLDSWTNGFFSILLFLAELYAIATLLLSYFQTLRLRNRQSVSIAHMPPAQLPSVDVYIPTYNEDVAIVRKTTLAALALDYPDAKKRVYVLDDGRKFPDRREKLRQMCQELGSILLTRDNNDHAKAGNINTAMRRTQGDLILILDCDHIPSKQFLQETVGFFLNPKVALVQTPHWFYNPDPFERNLLTQGRVPVSNELFYKVIQKGNDFWNAAFFCGSAAVIRKDYVLSIGGIAVETVTEDCHTSLRLHSKKYESVYYDKIMVAGLAPETFSSYVGQQVRWARGMAQILRLENPLLNPKLNLTFPQRLCYFSATTHFFFGFPRLMYALAPVLYLLFGINLIRGLGVETLVYALPHILLAMNANYVTSKAVRFSFWNEIFEYAMAFQDGLVTLLAVLNPKLGSFNVTSKGGIVTKRSFDWTSAKVSAIMAGLLVVSLLAVPVWFLVQPEAKEAVVINALWSIFNLLLISAALLVAFEQPQLRRAHRLTREVTAIVHNSQAESWTGKTIDISENGARIRLDSWSNLPDIIELELIGDFGAVAVLDAKIIRVDPIDDSQVILAVDFVDVTQAQYDQLCLVIYSDVEEWYSQQPRRIDRPFDSLRFLATGLMRAFREPRAADRMTVRKQVRAAAQLYWEGHFYEGVATEMSSRSIRIELDARAMPNLEAMRQLKPPVGLLLSQNPEDPQAKRLVAQVETVEAPVLNFTASVDRSRVVDSIAIELEFPQNLDYRQGGRIKQLLRTLR